VILIAAVPSVHAQDAKVFEPVVVTATKVPTPQEQLGATVSVITGEELRTYNYDRVEEALRTVPGVEVERSGTPGKMADIRIRGTNPNQVQVLVDGMRVKSPTLGITDLSEISLDAIERIETRSPWAASAAASSAATPPSGPFRRASARSSTPPRSTGRTSCGSSIACSSAAACGGTTTTSSARR